MSHFHYPIFTMFSLALIYCLKGNKSSLMSSPAFVRDCKLVVFSGVVGGVLALWWQEFRKPRIARKDEVDSDSPPAPRTTGQTPTPIPIPAARNGDKYPPIVKRLRSITSSNDTASSLQRFDFTSSNDTASSLQRLDFQRLMLGQMIIDVLHDFGVAFSEDVAELLGVALTQFLTHARLGTSVTQKSYKENQMGEMLRRTLERIRYTDSDTQPALWPWMHRLISEGVNPNYDDRKGYNVLEFAVSKLCNSRLKQDDLAEGLRVVRLLVDAKGDLNAPSSTGHVPVLSRDISHEVYTQLIEMGGDINCDTLGDGVTRLTQYVVSENPSEVFEHIGKYIDQGLDLGLLRADDGLTILEVAQDALRPDSSISHCLETACLHLRSSLYENLLRIAGTEGEEQVIWMIVDFLCPVSSATNENNNHHLL